LAHTGVNRQTADIHIGLIDSTVSVEVVVRL
jgi:hypothetical protein